MPTIRFSNRQVAEKFSTIADLLEIKGEVIYKILAYRKAAESIANLSQDINQIHRMGELTNIPGVGKAIADKTEELLTTGAIEFLEKLSAEVPLSLRQLIPIPDLGPKKIAMLWKQAGITNLAELEAAAQAGKLRDLPGMGEKSEAKILAGIASLRTRSDRIPIARAWPAAQELLAFLRQIPGVQAAELAGSLRRMRSTIGDLDIQVAAVDSGPIIDAFISMPQVDRILGQGSVKASVVFANGLRCQIWVHAPERFGTALQYGTGSKDHNVRLRELALKKGLSLSDQSFLKEDGSEILCATEEEVYQQLGLPWIPPEMREDRGEVQAALAGKLPHLIQTSDILADLHTHSTWSDGRATIMEMAQAAIQRGLKILAITDHSPSLGIAGGVKVEDLQTQRREIDSVQRQLGSAIRLLHGTEMEIKADGSLDFPDEVLAQFDLVIASLHVSQRQPREQVTRRVLNAIENPHVDIIGHPTGRLIPDRPGADLDMEAIFAAAAQAGVALEINASPHRLDLDDVHAQRALQLGIPLTINTDAHVPHEFDLIHFGVATARRAWAQPVQVINTWPAEKLTAWLGARGTH